jgi:ssDNA-binding replication factor A large subunit
MMEMVSHTGIPDDKESNLKLTSIAELTPECNSVALLLKVVSLDQARQIRSSKTSRRHLVQNAVIGDSTAIINMTLWNDDVDSLQEGHTYLLTKAYVIEYDECMYIQRSRLGEFVESTKLVEIVNESVDMSRPFIGRKPQRRKPRTKSGRSFRGTAGREEKGYCSWKGF